MRQKLLMRLTVVLCLHPALVLYAENLPSGFVYIKDVIPNIQCEVRYYTDDNFIGQNIDGYIKPRCILSIESTNAL
ncbi:MAG: D-alanyl-D-alanine dipeptidase, partial [Planctomycetota bacterium]